MGKFVTGIQTSLIFLIIIKEEFILPILMFLGNYYHYQVTLKLQLLFLQACVFWSSYLFIIGTRSLKDFARNWNANIIMEGGEGDF